MDSLFSLFSFRILISSILGSDNFHHWAQLLFFTDLFILLNQQMNDEEFYMTTSEWQPESKPRNPLEAGQLQMFSKQLCTVVYILHWLPVAATNVTLAGWKIDWKCLTARLKDSLLTLYCREWVNILALKIGLYSCFIIRVRRPCPPPEIPQFMNESYVRVNPKPAKCWQPGSQNSIWLWWPRRTMG